MKLPSRRVLVAILVGVLLAVALTVMSRPELRYLVRAIAGIGTITVRNDMPTPLSDVVVVYWKAGERETERSWKCGTIQPGESCRRRRWFTNDVFPGKIRFTANDVRHSAECGGYTGRADILQIKVRGVDAVDSYYVFD